MAFLTYFWIIFSIEYTGGSGSGAGGLSMNCGISYIFLDDEIHDLIVTKVADAVRGAIPKVFGSIWTAMIELFDERYVVVVEVAVDNTTAGVQERASF